VLSGLPAGLADGGGGHGAGRSPLSRAASSRHCSPPCSSANPAGRPPLLPRAAAAAADGAALSQLLSVTSSARQASARAAAVIAPGRAILLQVAEGVGGPQSHRPMASIRACLIRILLNTLQHCLFAPAGQGLRTPWFSETGRNGPCEPMGQIASVAFSENPASRALKTTLWNQSPESPSIRRKQVGGDSCAAGRQADPCWGTSSACCCCQVAPVITSFNDLQ